MFNLKSFCFSYSMDFMECQFMDNFDSLTSFCLILYIWNYFKGFFKKNTSSISLIDPTNYDKFH